MKQGVFLVAEQREVLFGGAAGPGKSDAILMGALDYVDQPTYNAVLFRRTYPQLEGTLIERSRQWLHGTSATYNEQEHLWRFPSGARLKFAHMASENDRFDYQSAEFQYIGFDELTQFTEKQYKYLISRLRRTVEQRDIPLRVRSGSNPGGEGHDWVNSRFVERDGLGPDDDPNEILFVPALLSDNPFIDQDQYVKALGVLDPVTKAQLLRGDWTARFSAGFLRPEWFEVVDAPPPDGWYRKIRYWDLAATKPRPGFSDPDWTVGALWGKNVDGFYYLLHVVRWQKDAGETRDRIRWFRHVDGDNVEVHMEEEPGSSGKIVTAHFRQNLDDAPFYADKVTGKKIERAKILAAQASSGRCRVVRGAWNRDFFAECDAFPTKGLHDDQIDAASGGIAKLLKPNALEYLDAELARLKEATSQTTS